MTAAAWEDRLKTLGDSATPLRRFVDREWWRFEADDASYRLHFYPSDATVVRPAAAAKEYAALQTLQVHNLPVLRPTLLLRGLRFDGRTGDAVVVEDAPNFATRSLLGNDATAQAVDSSTVRKAPTVRAAASSEVDPFGLADAHASRAGVLTLLERLHRAGFGHNDLRPDAFVVAARGVVLADAAGVVQGGMTPEHLQQFAHAAGPAARRTDRVRVWRRLVPAGDVPPADRRIRQRLRRDLLRQDVRRVTVGAWSGRFVAASGPTETSAASGLFVTADDWRREWPRVLDRAAAGAMTVLKRDASGDVLAGPITLAGRTIDAVVKRPSSRKFDKWFLEVRPPRARRAWEKTRWLLARGLPAEQPLAVFERRVLGYAVESIAVYERVPGSTLEKADLDAVPPIARENLFRRCGRILRQLNDTGLAHTDAKSSNWIVFDSPTAGPTPVMLDAYGIRPLTRWLQLAGLHRLLRAMKNHPQYTTADSLHLCQGFVPYKTPATEGGGGG